MDLALKHFFWRHLKHMQRDCSNDHAITEHQFCPHVPTYTWQDASSTCFWLSLSFMTFTASGTILLCPGASLVIHWVPPALKQETNELSPPSISRSGCHIWEMDPLGSGLSVNLMDQATTASRPERYLRETWIIGFNFVRNMYDIKLPNWIISAASEVS